MSDLRVTIIQTELAWQAPDANLEMFTNRLDAIEAPTDLVVLPEMFATGFTMDRKAAQSMNGTAVTWIRNQARKRKLHILGSIAITDQDRLYNRLLWVTPEGNLRTYDKRHLFRMAGEHQVYTAGLRLLTITVNGWRLRPFICYDLRFPGWMRNLNNSYDAAIVVANWPAPRRRHWQILLQARAVENQVWMVGVNRIGSDGDGRSYSGDSAIIAPDGKRHLDAGDDDAVLTTTLARDTLEACRHDFPVWMDADTDLMAAALQDGDAS